ncbi:MAG: hypothetical protein ACLTT1_09930 [[Clostridium] scindens]
MRLRALTKDAMNQEAMVRGLKRHLCKEYAACKIRNIQGYVEAGSGLKHIDEGEELVDVMPPICHLSHRDCRGARWKRRIS